MSIFQIIFKSPHSKQEFTTLPVLSLGSFVVKHQAAPDPAFPSDKKIKYLRKKVLK